jgi:hypothetical protein
MEGSYKNENKGNMIPTEVELAFPKYEQEEDGQFISKGGTGEGIVKHLSTSMDAIVRASELSESRVE